MTINNLPEKSGIYRIYNKLNNHSYIGQSINIKNRFWNHHLVEFDNPKCTQYDSKLYKAIRKYGGWDVFEVEILELCPKEELDQKEIFYIEQFNSYHNGYNSTPGGQFWSEKIFSPETEAKRAATREKNKSFQSENHPRAKLTNDEVWNIRQRYIDGETIDHIYKDYKDKYNSIAVFRRIVLGFTYKTVGNIPSEKVKRQAHGSANLTDEQIHEIRNLYQTTKTSYAKLGQQFNVSASTIQHIIKYEGLYQFIE